MPSNPVLVEVTRGGQVESRHSGAIAIRDADGGDVLSLGDVFASIFPRSAIKALQALPLLESGAADRFGLAPEEIALACASHSAEPAHAAAALSMLRKAGRDLTALECGGHWPMRDTAARALAVSGAAPSALHNNCSGKHAGFVCLACAADRDPAGYVGAGHFVQREVTAALAAMSGHDLAPGAHGIDGCSIPAWALPLDGLALAFARLATGHGLAPKRAAAAARIRASVAAHPFMVAGTGRFDTELMNVTGARAFTKTGAEGVFCAAMPDLGLGVALKIDDGAGRAAEVAMAAVVAAYAPLGAAEQTALTPLLRPRLRNWNGFEVGEIRAIFAAERQGGRAAS